MIRIVGLGIAAGLVSALLFSVVVTGSVPGMLLCYVAPLPVLIVALGWTHLVGLLAASVGAFAISALLTPRAGLAFAFGAGFPAWWLAFVTLNGPRFVIGRRTGETPNGLGQLLVWTALTAAFVSLASTVALGRWDYGLFQDSLRRLTTGVLRAQLGLRSGEPLPPVAGVSGADFVSGLVAIAPAIATAVFAAITVLNLWLAGRALLVSGRLPWRWLPLPGTRMPAVGLALLAGAVVVAFGPGFVGVAGASLAGGLLMAFALQGLALLHAATRGRAGRGAALGLTYALLLFVGGSILPLLAVAGLLDSATGLRRRVVPTPPDGPADGPARPF